jgi:hypothetical protein
MKEMSELEKVLESTQEETQPNQRTKHIHPPASIHLHC